MSHLSPCYFCGTALDDPLRAYAVVPAGHSGEDALQTTLTLCPGCRRKLATVFEAADATDGDGPSLAVVADAGDAESVVAETEETSDMDETTSETDETTSNADAESDDTETPDMTADDVAAMAGDLDTRILDGDDGEHDVGDDNEDEADAASEGHGDPEPAGDSATDGEQGDVAESAQAGETAATESSETVPDSDTDGDDASQSAQTTVSALEYNKVMRLLQNRQFPVERGEIEAVAANAYDLTRAECAAVIDLAVDRGLIEASGDQLVRPD